MTLLDVPERCGKCSDHAARPARLIAENAIALPEVIISTGRFEILAPGASAAADEHLDALAQLRQ